MNPTLGRIVHYHVPAADRGNNNGGETAPAVVTRVWGPDCVNLKVLLDGPSDVWVTSSTQGTGERQWSWPPRE